MKRFTPLLLTLIWLALFPTPLSAFQLTLQGEAESQSQYSQKDALSPLQLEIKEEAQRTRRNVSIPLGRFTWEFETEEFQEQIYDSTADLLHRQTFSLNKSFFQIKTGKMDLQINSTQWIAGKERGSYQAKTQEKTLPNTFGGSLRFEEKGSFIEFSRRLERRSELQTGRNLDWVQYTNHQVEIGWISNAYRYHSLYFNNRSILTQGVETPFALLSGYKYENRRPEIPGFLPFWRNLTYFIQREKRGTQTSYRFEIENQFAWLYGDAELTFRHQFKVANRKDLYQKTLNDWALNSVNQVELLQSFSLAIKQSLGKGPLHWIGRAQWLQEPLQKRVNQAQVQLGLQAYF